MRRYGRNEVFKFDPVPKSGLGLFAFGDVCDDSAASDCFAFFEDRLARNAYPANLAGLADDSIFICLEPAGKRFLEILPDEWDVFGKKQIRKRSADDFRRAVSNEMFYRRAGVGHQPVPVKNIDEIAYVLDKIAVFGFAFPNRLLRPPAPAARLRLAQLALDGRNEACQVVFQDAIVSSGFHRSHCCFLADSIGYYDERQVQPFFLKERQRVERAETGQGVIADNDIAGFALKGGGQIGGRVDAGPFRVVAPAPKLVDYEQRVILGIFNKQHPKSLVHPSFTSPAGARLNPADRVFVSTVRGRLQPKSECSPAFLCRSENAILSRVRASSDNPGWSG